VLSEAPFAKMRRPSFSVSVDAIPGGFGRDDLRSGEFFDFGAQRIRSIVPTQAIAAAMNVGGSP
jgi:hypothetical protein